MVLIIWGNCQWHLQPVAAVAKRGGHWLKAPFLLTKDPVAKKPVAVGAVHWVKWLKLLLNAQWRQWPPIGGDKSGHWVPLVITRFLLRPLGVVCG